MRRMIWVLLAASLLATACGRTGPDVISPGDGGDYSVNIGPEDFVSTIDNEWFPLIPGARWVYEARDEDEVERIEVVVTEDTKVVMGITATVVRDTVTVDGELIEDTYDWFAQDVVGNVWYLGEDSTEYDGDEVSKAGSWEAGIDGALPGVVMRASPQVGDAYRQEYYEGEAEDLAEVARTGASVTVAFGSYTEVLVIKEWNPLEPDVVEEKYYARGLGMVMEMAVEGGSERAELVLYEPGG